MTELELLRARLIALRRNALDRLAGAGQIDSGMLRLVTDTSATLAVLDEEAAAALAPEHDARAIVLDDGVMLTLAVFSTDRQSAAVTFSPVAALRLAGSLIATALRRLR